MFKDIRAATFLNKLLIYGMDIFVFACSKINSKKILYWKYYHPINAVINEMMMFCILYAESLLKTKIVLVFNHLMPRSITSNSKILPFIGKSIY